MKCPIIIILLLTFLQQGQSQSPLPMASYSFYDLEDQSANDNSLTLDGSPHPTLEWEDCQRYMDFENKAYARKDNPTMNWDSSFSVGFWMRTSNTFTDQKMVGQSNVSNGFVIGVDQFKLKVEIFGGSGGTQTYRSHELGANRLNEWFHVAVVFNENEKLEIYIDGEVDTSYANVSDWAIPTSSLIIGAAPWDANSIRYRGELDEINIYNAPIESTTIAALMNPCKFSGPVIYVDDSATGSDDGTSWFNGMTDLQRAIDASCLCAHHPDIWVADGTYYPTKNNPLNSNTSDRDNTFLITAPLALYGGFGCPGDDSLDDRDWDFNKTILSGDVPSINGRLHHILYMVGDSITEDWRIDGFFVQDAFASGSINQESGGALYNVGDVINRPVVANCTFQNNFAFDNGGAIYSILQTCGIDGLEVGRNEISILNCHFEDNRCNLDGGAIYAGVTRCAGIYHGIASVEPLIKDCSFVNNNCSSEGGAIYTTTFVGTSTFADDVLAINNSQIESSTFSGNYADRGGAIYIDASAFDDQFGSAESKSNAQIVSCSFDNNNANDGGGGAVYCYASSSEFNLGNSLISTSSNTFSNCLFINNAAQDDGGAVYTTAQLFGRSFQDLSLENEIVNCTFYNNSASDDGGAFYSYGIISGEIPDNNEYIANSIFWENNASGNGDDIFFEFDSSRINNTIISADGIHGDHVIITDTSHANPMFVDVMNNDYKLIQGSPAIDFGDMANVDRIYDLGGNLRTLANSVDAGAYEFGRNCDNRLSFYQPVIMDGIIGFFYTDEDIITNAKIINTSNIVFSHFKGIYFKPEFAIEKGSEMLVKLIGCD